MIWLRIKARRSSKDLAKHSTGNAQTITSEPPGGDEGYTTLFPLVGWRKESGKQAVEPENKK